MYSCRRGGGYVGGGKTQHHALAKMLSAAVAASADCETSRRTAFAVRKLSVVLWCESACGKDGVWEGEVRCV